MQERIRAVRVLAHRPRRPPCKNRNTGPIVATSPPWKSNAMSTKNSNCREMRTLVPKSSSQGYVGPWSASKATRPTPGTSVVLLATLAVSQYATPVQIWAGRVPSSPWKPVRTEAVSARKRSSKPMSVFE
jgi:hypothetical protein